MNTGLWVWPSDGKAQQNVMRAVAASSELIQAMTFIMKNKEGLSNADLDDLLADNSQWTTLWTIRQLTSLGFVEYVVDLFGGPAKYQLTDLGKSVFGTITGQPVQQKVPVQGPPVVQAALSQPSQVKA